MPYKDLEVRRLKQKEYQRIHRAKNKKPLKFVKCPVCSNDFKLTRSDKRFCSRICKSKQWEQEQNGRLYRGRDPEKVRSKALKYYYADHEKSKKDQLERQKRNLSLFAYHSAKRRCAKLERTPVWADLEEIKKFYENCPKGYHVDHIIPLQGKNVSGLHVINNLQYLEASVNMSKGNKYGD